MIPHSLQNKLGRATQVVINVTAILALALLLKWAGSMALTLAGVGGTGISFGVTNSYFKCEKTFSAPTSANDRIPVCRIIADSTIDEMGCTVWSEVYHFTANGGTAGTAVTKADSTDDFPNMGIDLTDIIRNMTDGSSCTVTDASADNSLVCGGLSGGSDNTFTSGDEIVVMRNDIEATVKWYRSEEGYPGVTQVGDTLTCPLGDTIDALIASASLNTTAGTDPFTLAPTIDIADNEAPDEFPTFLHVWILYHNN